MKKKMLSLLNYSFHLFHISVIVFFLIGWFFKVTQPIHLILALLIIAFHYTLRSCPVTVIQRKIKLALKGRTFSENYSSFLVRKALGTTAYQRVADKIILSLFCVISAISAGISMLRIMF